MAEEENIPSPPPKLTAYELLGSEPRPYPFISQHFNPFFGVFLGVMMAYSINFFNKKPIHSGIQKHIGFGLSGLIIGKWADERRNKQLARRDAVLRHYIELHPEDFPEPGNYGDSNHDWMYYCSPDSKASWNPTGIHQCASINPV